MAVCFAEDNKQQSMSFLNGKTISKQATGWKLSRVQCHLDDVVSSFAHSCQSIILSDSILGQTGAKNSRDNIKTTAKIGRHFTQCSTMQRQGAKKFSRTRTGQRDS